jgi:1,4-dihydroxy-2-naphthoate octaprenyltransferase
MMAFIFAMAVSFLGCSDGRATRRRRQGNTADICYSAEEWLDAWTVAGAASRLLMPLLAPLTSDQAASSGRQNGHIEGRPRIRSEVHRGAETAALHEARTIRPGSVAAWAVAVRPRSLFVAVSPVLVGATLGFARTGAIDLRAALLVLGAALLMQAITNLQNDAGYTVRGGDSSGTRTGLPRATAQGWLSVRHVRAGIVLAALAAAGLGLALVAYRGWPVLAIGVASLLAALAYMGGPRPIAYTPFGELTVFVFFGLVAVNGTDWVLTGGIATVSLLASAAIGSLAAAALALNNHRDIDHDRLVGRRTFAVSFGARVSARLYAALLLGPFVLTPTMAWQAGTPALLLPLLLLPAAWRLRRDFAGCAAGVAFNALLFRTFRLELGFALLLSAGALMG